MRTLSEKFKELQEEHPGQVLRFVDLTLKDGTVLNLTNHQLWEKGFQFEDAVSGESSFDIGSVIVNQCIVNINNIYNDYSNYNFEGAEAVCYLGMNVGEKTEQIEKIRICTMTVVEAPYQNSSIISLTCQDNAHKFDRDYAESKLSYPATRSQIIRDACNVCGVTLGTVSFYGDDYVVQERPADEALTFRQVLSWTAQLGCQWMRCDEYGHLCVGWYPLEPKAEDSLKIRSTIGLTVNLEEVVITGLKVTEYTTDDSNGTSYLYGTEGYVLSIDKNQLITAGTGKDAAEKIGRQCVGMHFRPFSCSQLMDIAMEAGDAVVVTDRKGNTYQSYVTVTTLKPGEYQSVACNAKSAERNSYKRYDELTQAYLAQKKQYQVQKTAWENQIEELGKRLKESPGLYTTEEKDSAGGKIFYWHNKPTLKESDIIWKMTADACGVSTDGGKTWNAGLSVDGKLIGKIMSTIGLNFSWGVGGELIIQDKSGNETMYVNAETGEVRIRATSFSISGKTVNDIAKDYANSTLDDFLQGEYADAMTEISESLDKKAETWYQDTDPSLNWNERREKEPLQDSEKETITDSKNEDLLTVWEREKVSHNGDLWHNTTTNVQYIYINGNWQEMNVPDEVFDKIDGKAQIFVAEPVPPYDVGDTWFTGTEIRVCMTKRESGKYQASDWLKKDAYTDDSALNTFLNGSYKNTLTEVRSQIDGKAETWRQESDPAAAWTTTAEKAKHKGDLWNNTKTQKSYIYNGTGWEEMTSTPPEAVFDMIDGKAQIFVSTPVPPYAIGDLWFNNQTSDILTCIVNRESGKFTAADWQKRNKYTDDSAFTKWMNGEYSNTLQEVKGQVDEKAETWRQSADPSKSWTTTTEKTKHKGDLWYNTTEQKSYIYNGSTWEAMKAEPPSSVYDSIDGKAQIFVNTPKPPYDVGDLWFNDSTSDIMTCVTGRKSGNYVSSDWQKRNKYTDDSSLNTWINGTYKNTLSEVRGQIDAKVETWRQSTDPATSWTTDTAKKLHKGDLWYNTNTQKSYIYNGSTWEAMKAEPPSSVYDSIDGKAQIFVNTPKPPYDVGDLWFNDSTSDIMTCVTGRKSGNYVSSDWQKRNKYTDNTAVDDLNKKLNQEEIFNRLTNNGVEQGVYMKDGKLYLNFTYALGGVLKLGGKNNGNGELQVYDENGNVIGSLSKNGFRIEQAEKISLGEYFNYDSSGKINGNKDVFLAMGGWQIKKTTVYDEPAEYWETSGSQLNGIGAYGPWAFWGGWNGGSAFKKENYKFLVTEDGVCKAMSWVTGSRAEWKQDIREYEDGALEKVLGSTVYRYQLKEHPKNEEGKHIGFVIGDGYALAEDMLDESKSSVDMYSALGIAYKAIQELNAKVNRLEGEIASYRQEAENGKI